MRRVVVTGSGMVTALGVGVRASWKALLDGRDGHRPVSLFSTEGTVTNLAAEIQELPIPDLAPRYLRRMMRVDRIGLLACEEAVAESDLTRAGISLDRIGVVLGAGAAGLLEAQAYFEARQAGERAAVRHHLGEMQSGTGRWLAWRFGFEGPRACPSTACSSSLTAIGLGATWIRQGDIDAAVVGGAENLSPLTHAGFNSVHALSPTPCRPFDRNRDGMSLGEGGAALVLEERDSAIRRGARIQAEILGFATSSDAHHMTAPHPEGAGAAIAIRRCLEQADLAPDEVDAIFAHGTGTAANDAAECEALRAVLGGAAEGRPVVSQKSAFGHTLGAAGALECVTAIAAMASDTLPPNQRLDGVDPACSPFHFPTEALHSAGLRHVLKQSFGFGGSNAALLLGRGARP